MVQRQVVVAGWAEVAVAVHAPGPADQCLHGVLLFRALLGVL